MGNSTWFPKLPLYNFQNHIPKPRQNNTKIRPTTAKGTAAKDSHHKQPPTHHNHQPRHASRSTQAATTSQQPTHRANHSADISTTINTLSTTYQQPSNFLSLLITSHILSRRFWPGLAFFRRRVCARGLVYGRSPAAHGWQQQRSRCIDSATMPRQHQDTPQPCRDAGRLSINGRSPAAQPPVLRDYCEYPPPKSYISINHHKIQ